MLKHLINWKNVWKKKKNTWKRSEGLLDRYFGFERKIGINKKRGKETEKKTLEMECSFYIKKNERFLLESRQNVYSTKTGPLFSHWYRVVMEFRIYGAFIFFFIVNGCTKFNFCNVLFLPYFIYSVSVLLLQNLI